MRSRSVEQRFWLKVDKAGPLHPYDAALGRCWLWTAAKRRRGYGALWRDGKPVSAARIAWELAAGAEMPPDLETLHSCDRPACVNPAHIRPGTRKQNVADMHDRGRTNLPRGARHWNFQGNPDAKRAECSRPPTLDDIRAWLAARRSPASEAQR